MTRWLRPETPQHRGRRASVAFQGLYSAVAELLQHLKQQFPPHSQNAKVSPCRSGPQRDRLQVRTCSTSLITGGFTLSAVDVV